MVREIPLSVLFSFPKPNYVDPVTRGPALIIINAIFISLCTIVLFLRLYTRIFIKRWFGSDDVFIILAYISTVALTANVIIANVHFYWNRHVWDIPISSFSGVLKVAFSAKLIFVFAATFTRQSLLCFYYRLIADSGMKWFDWALHVTVFFNVAAAIAFTCLGIWLCVPISAYWTISPPDGAHCLDEGRVVLGIGIVNCVIDLLITALPIPIITRLQMPMQQRIGVMILLSLGFVVVVAGAVRTYYIWKGLIVSYDETWLTFPLWIAAAVEINLGVICACMPALRPFISRYITPAFSNVTSRISSFISRSSTRQSTASTTRTSGNRYRKFSSGNNNHNDGSSSSSAPRTIGSSAASTTLKSSTNLGSRPSPYATTTTASDPDEVFFVTTPIELADRHRHHRSARSSFGSEHGRTALPRMQLPAVQSHSPLEITCRHSFEIVSLDRGRGGGGGGGDGEEDGPLELDPREREWRAEVSCPREDQERGLVEGEKKGDGGVEGEGAGRERMGRKRSFVMGKGWGRF